MWSTLDLKLELLFKPWSVSGTVKVREWHCTGSMMSLLAHPWKWHHIARMMLLPYLRFCPNTRALDRYVMSNVMSVPRICWVENFRQHHFKNHFPPSQQVSGWRETWWETWFPYTEPKLAPLAMIVSASWSFQFSHMMTVNDNQTSHFSIYGAG